MRTTDQVVLFAWLEAMCADYSLLAGLVFVSVLASLFVSLFVSLLVSALLADFSELASPEPVFVSPFEVLVAEPVDELVELLPDFEPVALSFL